VVDAAQGVAWPKFNGDSSWTTQQRHLNELAALLGLDPVPSAALGEQLARVLDVPLLRLMNASNQFHGSVGFHERAATLVDVLERATRSRCVLERVLICGALVGLWGSVHIWHAALTGPQRRVPSGSGLPSG